MDPVKIEGANLVLGKPSNWTDRECGSLHAYRDTADGVTITTSAWKPTPDELAAINSGATVYLTVWGQAHPPVSVWVRFPYALPV